jgi:hypothetical protein
MCKNIKTKKYLIAGALAMVFSLNTMQTKVFAAEGERLGGIDMNDACYGQYGWADSELLPPYNVMSWKCRFHGGRNVIYKSIDLNRYCARVYRGSHADFVDFNDPYSWGCYK